MLKRQLRESTVSKYDPIDEKLPTIRKTMKGVESFTDSEHITDGITDQDSLQIPTKSAVSSLQYAQPVLAARSALVRQFCFLRVHVSSVLPTETNFLKCLVFTNLIN